MFRHFTLRFCGFPFVEIKDVSEAFTDRIFTEGALPRAALGKGFAEGLRGFAESLGPRQSSRLR
jgi:hypothetical protein